MRPCDRIQPSTTLMIYTHVQQGIEKRVLGALAAFSLLNEDNDDDDGLSGVPAKVP